MDPGVCKVAGEKRFFHNHAAAVRVITIAPKSIITGKYLIALITKVLPQTTIGILNISPKITKE